MPESIKAYVFNNQEPWALTVEDETFIVNRHDVLFAIDDTGIDIPEHLLKYKIIFSFSRKKELFGTGSKVYQVTAIIRDNYTINVLADSEEEAIANAKYIPAYEWHHPDIEPHLTERRMVRMARWGNFVAKEVD